MPEPDLRDGVLLRFKYLKIEEYVNTEYQRGAMIAMKDDIQKELFGVYEWVH